MSDLINNVADKANDVNKNFEQFRNVSPFPNVKKPYLPSEESDDGVDVFHQPEATKKWKEADLKEFMYKIFKKNYRLVCENKSAQNWNIVDLSAKAILPVVQSKQILGISWKIYDYPVTVGTQGLKQSKPRIRDVSFKDAINSRSLDDLVCSLTSTYAHSALSLFTEENEDGEKVQYFNTRRPLAFERLVGQECDKSSKEYQIALQIKDLIYSRFSNESNPTACGDYYVAWVMGIIKDPVTRCRTNILFADEEVGGTGKTTFSYDLPQLLIGYDHCVYSELSDSNFAGGYEDKLLAHFSEITEADDRAIDKVKKLVDEAVCIVEKKGKDKTTIPCFARVTATTNHPERFKMTSQDDRRWTVFYFNQKITKEEQKLVDIIKGCAWDRAKAARECPEIDQNQLRLCLYSVFEEAINGKNINIFEPLQTDAKSRLVSGVWMKKPVVKWTLSYFTGGYCEPITVRNVLQEHPNPFHKTHLIALLSKKRDGEKTTYDARTIMEKLFLSRLFEEEMDKKLKKSLIFLTKRGFDQLSEDDKESYVSTLKYHQDKSHIIKGRACICESMLGSTVEPPPAPFLRSSPSSDEELDELLGLADE